MCSYPLGVFITPDGSLAYVTCPFQNGVSVIDTLSNTVAATIDGIFQPYGVAFNPTGTLAYITSGATPGTVKVVDTTTYKVLKSYSVENQPISTDKVRTSAVGLQPHGLAFTC